MASGTRGAVVRELDRLFSSGSVSGLSEGQLLDRFVSRNDASAFEALVARHGPMVLTVCRQWLRDPNDVDDAFQATFLVLVRKAGTLRRRDLLGNWLHGVAYRVAARSRAVSARRNATESPSEVGTLTAPASEVRGFDPELHEEVHRLPEKYRAPVVLCYLEGLTHEEAAERLKWPVGSVKGRLSRARELLRSRLTRRGIALAGASVAIEQLSRSARASVPSALMDSTVKGATLVATHTSLTAAAGVLSAQALGLTEGVLSAMSLTKLKLLATSCVVAGFMTTGAGVMAYQGYGGSGKANGARGVSPTLALVEEVAPRVDNPPLLAQETAKVATYPDIDYTQPAPVSEPPAPAAGETAPPALPGTAPETPLALPSGTNSPVPPVEVRDTGPLPSPPGAPLPPTPAEFVEQKYDEMLKDLGKFQDPSCLRLLNGWSRMIRQSMTEGKVPAEQWQKAREQHLDRTERMLSAVKVLKLAPERKAEWLTAARQFVKEAQDELAVPDQRVLPATTGPAIVDVDPPQHPPTAFVNPNNFTSPPIVANDPFTPRPSSTVPLPATNLPPQPVPSPGTEPTPTLTPEPADNDPSQPAGPTGMMSTMGAGPGSGPMPGMFGMAMPGRVGPAFEWLSDPKTRLRYQIAMRSSWVEAHDKSPLSKAILKKLDEPFKMDFKDTTLEKVLDAVRSHAMTKEGAGIPIYLDPAAFDKDGGKALKKPVKIQLDGVPLRTSLRLVLKQLDLAYCVRDGVLIISTMQGIIEELHEAQGAAQEDEDAEDGGGKLLVPNEENMKDPRKPRDSSN